MTICNHLHEKNGLEKEMMKNIPSEKRVEYILSEHGKELCEIYCLTKCPDRFDCEHYKEDAK